MKSETEFDLKGPAIAIATVVAILFRHSFSELSPAGKALAIYVFIVAVGFGLVLCLDYYPKSRRKLREDVKLIREIPKSLLLPSTDSIYVGDDIELGTKIFLPDSIRSRHVHVIGATGSGKTESVILNFLRQDVARKLGAIILDAKGDISFLTSIQEFVPYAKLKVFDLSSDKSLSYNPLEVGSAIESAQRLHSSFTWSEEYYRSKALSALQRLFQSHFEKNNQNPNLLVLSDYLESPEAFAAVTLSENYPQELAQKDFMELSGLRDQVKSLTTAHLSYLLSPQKKVPKLNLTEVSSGKIFYFRLQSLMSPQIVSVLGKLLINHLNFIAGTAHREEVKASEVNLIPIYMDEFASFACPEFADLISKARSAKMALHFSHQSVGDLAEVSKGFLNRITDNSATKIVMRINDPDSAEFFARSFGTKIYQKVTQRITNAKDIDTAEVLEEGTRREAHQFRASPDLFKTLPTGVGSVLIAHGLDTPHGASSVFKIKFPKV